MRSGWKSRKALGMSSMVREGVFIQRGGKIIMLSKEENTRWADRLRPILAIMSRK